MKYDPIVGQTVGRIFDEMSQLASRHREQVVADFNDIRLTAEPGDTSRDIARQYHDAVQERAEAYIRPADLRDLLAKAPSVPTFRNPQAWNDARGTDDACLVDALTMASRWARLMEACMGQGETLEACAKRMRDLLDRGPEVAPYAIPQALAILCEAWIHGDALRAWMERTR